MMSYPGFEVLVELLDVVNGVEEDEDLGVLLPLLVQLLEDSADDVFVHLGLGLHHLVIVPDSLKSDLLSQFLLHQLVNVELYDILDILLVELHEFLLHGG